MKRRTWLASLLSTCAFYALLDTLRADEAVSPEKRFLAAWNGRLTITDAKTKEEFFSVMAVNEFLWAEWLNDGTLIVAESQAGGSFCAVIKLAGERWQQITVEPEGHSFQSYEFRAYARVGENLKAEYIGTTRRGLLFEHWKFDVLLDANTNVSKVTEKTPLAEEEYQTLLAAVRKRYPKAAK